MIKRIFILVFLASVMLALSACQAFFEDYNYQPPVGGTSSNSY